MEGAWAILLTIAVAGTATTAGATPTVPAAGQALCEARLERLLRPLCAARRHCHPAAPRNNTPSTPSSRPVLSPSPASGDSALEERLAQIVTGSTAAPVAVTAAPPAPTKAALVSHPLPVAQRTHE